MLTLADIPRLGRRRCPEKIAISMGSESLTYADFDQRVNQVANKLIGMGVHPGDRVALFANNSLDYPVVVYAIAKCAAIAVPINFRFQIGELAFVLKDATPVVLFVGVDLADLADSALSELDSPPQIIAIDSLAQGDGTQPDVAVDPDAAAMLMFTSGTTGFPKGVLFSHKAYLAVGHCLIIDGDLNRHDNVMIPLPLFHNGGLNALLLPSLMVGATAVVTERGFDPDEILKTIETRAISLTLLVPTMLAMLINHEGSNRYNVLSLRKIWYGSSPIRSTVLTASMDFFDADFYQLYGQTETGVNSILRPEDHAERSQCTGRDMISAELRIVDEDGRDIPVNGIGEIISAQHPLGMIGYFGNPEATIATIRDGWIHTGDLARVDGDGFFTVVGRMEDMIISGAENIYPKEIEDAILTLPAVRDVAVFGIPDDVYGEAVCAAVVLKPDTEATDQEIITHCEKHIARYKRPRLVEFHQELPKNAAGKITKNILRSPHWSGREKVI
jgi:acyl-CoA synthetase (AMP-forming)/AMP-acid ligase II